MSKVKEEKPDFMLKLAGFIVKNRTFIFLFYIFAAIFCIFSMGWVNVENDVTVYLPENTETRQGLIVMNENFVASGMAQVMVSNISLETARDISSRLGAIDGVSMVTFDDTDSHYRDATALFDITFAGTTSDPATVAAMDAISQELEGYDVDYSTDIGYDMIGEIEGEMMSILLVAVVIIIAVLALTSRAYMEVPVLLMTFGMAALLNMGTNFVFGTISFISNSVAVVLQLALAIDYAIILCHRFSDEREHHNAVDACTIALSKAIPEISASSMTTISGLIALGFMEFGIGLDLALVMSKSIFFSLLSVFTLMPGLLVLFSPLLDKTQHKKLLPSVRFIGKFAVKTRRVVPVLFVILLGGAFFLSNQCPFSYSYTSAGTSNMSARQESIQRIKDTFGNSNMVAVIVPSGNYEAEKQFLAEFEACPEVKSTMGLSNTQAMGGYVLTDALTPRELSELVGMDYELMQLLYGAYATEHDQYGEILTGLAEYRVPLIDMFLFLKEQMQSNNINLSGDSQQMLNELFEMLDMAMAQLQNENYSRAVVYLNLPEEGEETFAFLEKMHEILGKYYPSDYYVIGNSPSCRDLASTFAQDNLAITLFSIFFVIVVLLITFQSVGLPLLLIMTIQGSIWINFSFPTLMEQPLFFLGYLVVQAIQMGANIDYAIVISSHYQQLKKQMSHKEAIVQAVSAAFPTVLTSGAIMTAAALLIGNISTNAVIAVLGTCLGRGTFISILLVLFVLPPTLVLGDSIIERTKFHVKMPQISAKAATGTIRIKGRVRGYVSGMVDAEIDGILRGELNANVSTATEIAELETQGKGGDENE